MGQWGPGGGPGCPGIPKILTGPVRAPGALRPPSCTPGVLRALRALYMALGGYPAESLQGITTGGVAPYPLPWLTRPQGLPGVAYRPWNRRAISGPDDLTRITWLFNLVHTT